MSVTDVAGTVTIDGQPLPYGEVAFRGEAAQNQTVVAQATMRIRDGKFESNVIERPGIGSNSVTVIAYEGEAPPPPDPNDESGNEVEPKVMGYWTGSVTVADGSPVNLEIKKSELKKKPPE